MSRRMGVKNALPMESLVQTSRGKTMVKSIGRQDLENHDSGSAPAGQRHLRYSALV